MSMIDANEEPTPEPPMEDLVQAPRRPAQARPQADVDRVPPHSIEAEQGVLGCLLLDPDEGLTSCLEKLKEPRQLELPKRARPVGSYTHNVTTFYELKHQVIFESMLDLHEAKQAIDIITLKQFLTDKKQLESVGGVAYLSTLMNAVPSAANLEYYFNIVWEKYLLRKTVRTCTEIVREAASTREKWHGCSMRWRVRSRRSMRSGWGSRFHDEGVGRAGDFAHSGFSRTRWWFVRLVNGLVDFDKMSDGLHAAEMIVIAKRPSMGKPLA